MNYQGQKLKDCKPTSPQLKKKRQRQENSLGELTKNFIDFVRAKGSEEINTKSKKTKNLRYNQRSRGNRLHKKISKK